MAENARTARKIGLTVPTYYSVLEVVARFATQGGTNDETIVLNSNDQFLNYDRT
jgi:hypothetical protein